MDTFEVLYESSYENYLSGGKHVVPPGDYKDGDTYEIQVEMVYLPSACRTNSMIREIGTQNDVASAGMSPKMEIHSYSTTRANPGCGKRATSLRSSSQISRIVPTVRLLSSSL